MNLTSSALLRILAFVAFVLDVVLILANASAGKFELILIPIGLALWVLSTLIP
jgi:hypothetical protein